MSGDVLEPAPAPGSGSAQPPPPNAKPKSKALLYTLLGCGGCLSLAAIAGIALLILGGLAARKTVSSAETTLLSAQLGGQQAILSMYLMGDAPRRDRLRKTWDELSKAAAAGELKESDVAALQREIDTATSDDKLTPAEADSILAAGEKLTR